MDMKSKYLFHKKITSVRNRSPQQGAILLEALLAVLIFSMGILALVGLQAAMVKNTSDAKYRAEASFIAQQKLGDIWVGGTDLANHEVEDEDVSGKLPSGKRSVSVSADRIVTVTVTWRVPGEDTHTYATSARVEGI
jgi:type IV pilus assembly protein PilV